MRNISDEIRRTAEELGTPKKVDPKELKDVDKVEMKIVFADEILASALREAGLLSLYHKVKEKGKDYAKKMWDSFQDKSEKAQILALKTVSAVKEYITKHPNLKWVVLAAIVIGVLVLPSVANAGVIDTQTAKHLADGLDWQTIGKGWTGGGPMDHISITLHVQPDWLKELASKSAEGNLANPDQIPKDMVSNFAKIIAEKMHSLGMNRDQFSNVGWGSLMDQVKDMGKYLMNTAFDKGWM